MRISGIEPSSVILSQKTFQPLWYMGKDNYNRGFMVNERHGIIINKNTQEWIPVTLDATDDTEV